MCRRILIVVMLAKYEYHSLDLTDILAKADISLDDTLTNGVIVSPNLSYIDTKREEMSLYDHTDW